jgi:hypothetical protein
VTFAFLRVLRPKTGLYVVNESTLASDTEVAAWTSACAAQISEDVAPAYNRRPVRVQFLKGGATHAPNDSWVIAVLNDADQAGALGYHSIDAKGRVYGRVFMAPCQQYGVVPSTTLSHEIVETFCDPRVDRWRDTGHGYEVPYEACDPVQSGSYLKSGILVSDFVFPAWYSRGAGRAAQRNKLDSIRTSFELSPGGYVVRRLPDGSEDELFGSSANKAYIAAKGHALSRTSRRKSGPTTIEPGVA